MAGTDLLLAFLRENEAHCPRCDYNLRGLLSSKCPECGEELTLNVGLQRPKYGWLIIAMAPGIFSGIAALLLLAPMIIAPVLGEDPPPLFFIVVDAFGWISACFAALLFIHRSRFLKRKIATQAIIAAVLWGVHVAAFFTFLLLSFVFL